MPNKTYYLASVPMMDTPCIVEYCRHGYQISSTKKQKEAFVNILNSWAIPSHAALALASGAVDYYIETNEDLRTVVFTA
jgi:hypothetical protein